LPKIEPSPQPQRKPVKQIENKTEQLIVINQAQPKPEKKPEQTQKVPAGMNSYFNNSEILRIMYRRRKNLFVIAMIAVVLSAFFSSSLFIKPKFKSSAIIYPANVSTFSIETASEQMLQVLNSSDIVDSVVKKFDLVRHYKLDPNDPKVRTYVRAKFDDNVSIQKTQYESVEIIAWDTDPMRAYQIVKSIINYYNLKTRKMQQDIAREVVVVTRNRFLEKRRQVDSLTLSIEDLKTNYGILEYDVQARYAMRRYIKDLGHSGPGSKEIETMVKNLTEKGEEFNLLKNALVTARGNMENLRTEYENALNDVKRELTFASVVTSPVVADKKSYPVRWLIVLIGTISAVFIGFLFFLYTDSSLLRIHFDEPAAGQS
jgi:uncharacterized protein involved in exopolysaccharide biosynthesis